MSKYFLTIYADPEGPVGHFSVDVAGPGLDNQAWGKYARDGKLGIGNLEAEIRDDTERVRGGEIIHSDIELTAGQAAKVQAYIDRAKKDPGKYNITTDNCVDFAQGALDAAGLDRKLASEFDKKDLRKMGWIGSAGGDALAKARGPQPPLADNPIEGEMGGPAAEGGFARIVEQQKKDRAARKREEDGDEQSATDSPEPPASGQPEKTAAAPSSPDPDSEREAETRRDTPEARAFVKKVTEPGDPADDILLKPVGRWTEDEARQVMQARLRLNAGDARRAELFEAETAFFEDVYGTEPVGRDATGRMIEPTPKRPVAQTPSPALGRDGRTLDDGLERVARRMVERSDGRRFTGPVRQLQDGLNLLAGTGLDGEDRRTEEMRPRRPLKTDGVFGPRTRAALRDAVVRHGPDRIDEGTALGRFHEFARQARRSGDNARLGDATADVFGPLFRDTRRGGRGRWPGRREEAVVLQETLNALGPRSAGGGFRPLKLDGVVGPRTRGAFDLVNKSADPDQLTRRYGKLLGFLA